MDITITATRISANQTVVVGLPDPIIAILDWVAANAKAVDGTAYTDALNVVNTDVIKMLLPRWVQLYRESQVVRVREAIEAQVLQINTDLETALGQITITTA